MLALVYALFSIVTLVVTMWAWSNIFKKAGYPSWHWIMMIIPLVNLIWFFKFAFEKWPTQTPVEPAPPTSPDNNINTSNTPIMTEAPQAPQPKEEPVLQDSQQDPNTNQ